jgi:DNA-binding Lrp family transcriptional regulator
MDDTNRKLLWLIYEDPRMPLKELAKRLGVSRQTVDHRMQILAKLGAFKTIKAEISFRCYSDLFFPSIWGVSKAASIDKTLDRLGESEFTTNVSVLGGGIVSVFGCLRDESGIDGYVDFVKRVAEMPEPTVGLTDFNDGINSDFFDGLKPRRDRKELSLLDFRIIALLHDDARRPLAEIANTLGVSIKTVRRHIERMRSEGSLDFHFPYDFPPGEDKLTLLFVNLRSGADKVKVGRRLLSKYPLRITLVRSFTNIPDFLRALLSSERMSETRRIVKEIREDEDVVSVTPNLIYYEREYETAWDWKMLRTLAHSLEKGKR